jgi:hypothetical protein
VVESAGVTCFDPLVFTAPIPSMLTSEAFVVCHVSVVDSPWLIVFGLADSEAVGAVGAGGGGGGGGAAFFAHAPSSISAPNAAASPAHLIVFLIIFIPLPPEVFLRSRSASTVPTSCRSSLCFCDSVVNNQSANIPR